MEGYTNVVGSSYDFDDLDIEGRVVDEWNADEEERNKPTNAPSMIKHVDERVLLAERVKLDNGQHADVFSVVQKKDEYNITKKWYTCHVCSDTVVGYVTLLQHVDSSKHKTNMSKPVHPCAKFVKLDPKENVALEPGEPVPPGLEEVMIKNTLIQPKLDAYKSPLIGLEFMVEMTESPLDESEYYYCLLCDKTGGERNMFIHFTSIFHYMKYLSMYFPTVARKLHSLPNKMMMKKAFGLVVTEIIKDIEEKFGRMKPQSVTYSDFHFSNRKAELQKAAFEGPHFKEIDGGLFDEKATAENIVKKNKEVIAAPPVSTKTEITEKLDETVEGSGITFNKNTRINVDKKQLRSREEDKRNSSPDVQIVNVEQKTPGKKRTRSRSLSSLSSISSSSSYSRDKPRYPHSRQHSRPTGQHRNWSRSRSRSPGYRGRRRYDRRSPSYGRRYSPARRSRSPHSHSRPHHHWPRHDSRGRSPDPYGRVDRYGRQVRDKHESRSDRYHRDRERTPDRRRSTSKEPRISAEEKIRWEKFREELKKVESVKLEKLKFHEKNPEKHPQYPEEWKAFWNKRYNELQRSGVDPTKHDFKPEWIAFWTKRMKELYEEDLGKAKEELKKKFDLPEEPGINPMPWKYHQRKRNSSPGLVDISPPTPEKKDMIADIKTTWKAFTGSDIKDAPKRPLSPWEDEAPSTKQKQSLSPSPPPNINDKLLEGMPQRKSRTSALIFVLRKLTVLEQQLGSLAPKVFELMSQSLALEKLKEEGSLDLLLEEENSVYLETVREKLIALLCAGVVPRNFVNTARSAIKNTDVALYLASKRPRAFPAETVRAVMAGALPSSQGFPMYPLAQPPTQALHTFKPVPKSEPLVVPGIGQVDKVSIAQQIAAALVEQGKTNVTEGELEQLISAVVGMAEASAHSAHPMSTAYFLQHIQSMQNPTVPAPAGVPTAPAISVAAPNLTKLESPATLLPQVNTVTPAAVVSESQPSTAFGALKLLQSAYNESSKAESPKRDNMEAVTSNIVISDTELASTLSVFNKMNKEDQPSFVNRLKTNNPEMYKRLCPFIPTNVIVAADNPTQSPGSSGSAKRSPINIPISKERSEQKIKPLTSGRLSPFSQRSGGANPTISDKVVIDEDDDEKNDVKIISETPAKQPTSRGNVELCKYKSNGSDLDNDDDDDDDDYSYEDVYKAAQEKLKQQQKRVDEEDKSNLSVASKDDTTNKEPKDNSKLSSEDSHQSMPLNNSTWSSVNNSEKPSLSTGENLQQQKQVSEDKYNLQPAIPESNSRVQPPPYSEVQKYSDIHPARPEGYQGSNQSSYPYQGSIQERQPPADPYTASGQPPFGGSAMSTYANKDQYSNDPYYSKANTDYYNKNSQYPPDNSYPSARDPYSSTYRDSYGAPPPYSAQGNSTYANPNSQGNSTFGNQNTQVNSVYGNTYSDQYSYRGTQYGGNNYTQGHVPQAPTPQAYPTPAAPPSRYPSQRYPPY